MEQFFVELFTRTQPDILDLDILIRYAPSETDHLSRQVRDANRLAHLQDKNAPVFERVSSRRGAVSRGLQHKFHRFTHGHEEARYIGMSHCNRAASLELPVAYRGNPSL